MSTKKVTVDISLKSYLLGVSVVLGLIFFQHIFGILILLFVSFLLTVAIKPLVNFLERRKVPRSLSAFLILLLLFSGLITLAVSLVSPLVSQTVTFLQQLPPLVERLAPYNINISSVLTPQLTSAPENVLKLAVGTFSSLLTFFTLVVISYYMIQDHTNLRKNLISLFGEKKGDSYFRTIDEVETRLGSWVRGELFLMVLVGSLNYIGFVLIGLPSAIPLAVIAGFLEILPNVGPTVAAVPAILVGLSMSPTHALLVTGLAILVQQLENNIFVPKVMQKAVGLHPVVTIIVLSIGFRLGGPLLAILALPLVLSLRVIYSHLHREQKEEIKEELKEEVLSL